MTSIYKIILALIVVQVALVLAKPYKHDYDDSLYNSSGTKTCIGIAPKKRKDCGYGRITSQECQRRGCCFDDTIRDVNWCFYKEEFKCHFCWADYPEECERVVQVCKQKKPICMIVTIDTTSILECGDMDYYNSLKQTCDAATNECHVSYCTESLCN